MKKVEKNKTSFFNIFHSNKDLIKFNILGTMCNDFSFEIS